MKTLADVEELTFDGVDWDNNKRLHRAVGNVPPEELELAYYDEINEPLTGAAAHKTAA